MFLEPELVFLLGSGTLKVTPLLGGHLQQRPPFLLGGWQGGVMGADHTDSFHPRGAKGKGDLQATDMAHCPK